MADEGQALAAAGQTPADEALAQATMPEIAGAQAIPQVASAIGRGVKGIADRYNAMPSWPERARQIGETATGPDDPRLREMSMEMMVPTGSATRSVGAALKAKPPSVKLVATDFAGVSRMVGPEGQDFGHLTLNLSDPKHLYVEMVGKWRRSPNAGALEDAYDLSRNAYERAADAGAGEETLNELSSRVVEASQRMSREFSSPRGNSNAAGPSAMRDILQQIKAQYPQAQTLRGYRVSGARGNIGNAQTVTINLADPTKWDDETIMQLLAMSESPSRQDAQK